MILLKDKKIEFNLKELKYQRQRKELTQKEMGAALGISASTYNQKENGIINITVEELNVILEKLNINDINIFFK